jgi:hypothetical protein
MDKDKLERAKEIVKDICVGGVVTELQLVAIAVIFEALENKESNSDVG